MQKVFGIDKLKVVIVMPAYNAAKTIHDTFQEIPPYLRKHIILVDDNSSDNTVQIAKQLGLTVIEHSKNLGYGGNQKTCYTEALKLNPDIVVMLHPDYQYDASMIEDLIYPIARGRYDFMFGSRIANKKGALSGGMPPIKYYVNRIVCLIQNILLGVNFSEHFSGFRAYSKKLLQTIPWQNFSDDFVFDQEMTISSLDYDFNIGEIAIPTRYHKKASSIQFIKGTKFVLEGFLVIAALYLHKLGLIKDNRFTPTKSTSIFKPLAILSLVLINLILYGIFQKDFLFGILIFLESILLILSLLNSSIFTKLLSVLVLFSLITISLTKDFDKTFLKPTPIDITNKVARHEYFAQELGKLYKNRIGITYVDKILFTTSKFNKNAFSHLSLNSLLNTQNILSIILVPLFFLGLYRLIRKTSVFLLLYLLVAFIFSGLLTFEGAYGLLLFAPIINVLLYLGLIQLNYLSLSAKNYVKH